MEFTQTSENVWTLEMSRRNLQALLDKLDDPLSARILTKLGADFKTTIVVKAVEDDEHYAGRLPGVVYMPSTGETR